MIYFFYVLKERGYNVNDLYIRYVKDIPTERFRVNPNFDSHN